MLNILFLINPTSGKKKSLRIGNKCMKLLTKNNDNELYNIDLIISNYKKINPLGRLANADEISPAVVFLASDASSYITGVNLMIDGGWTAI